MRIPLNNLVPAEEIIGSHMAAEVHRLSAELEHARALMQALLKHVGSSAYCKGCGAQILWVRHVDNGKSVPYDPDGINHFATCTKAAQFKRKENQNATHGTAAGNRTAATK